jgi:hypothetical protein
MIAAPPTGRAGNFLKVANEHSTLHCGRHGCHGGRYRLVGLGAADHADPIADQGGGWLVH